MKQLIRYISLVVVCICTFLLSGRSFVWTMENGDPATPEDIKASVEKEFSVVHPRLVLQSAVVESAKRYGMRMATHEEALELAKSKATRVAGTNKIPLFTYDEIIFVDTSVKGEDVLTFMKSIYSQYKPQDNPALLPTERSIGFYYLPKGEADKTKAKYLISFRFKAKNDWKETMLTGIGSTGADTSAVERDFVSILDHMIKHAGH